MATLLDEPLLIDTLTALPGWTGDTLSIVRDVHLTPAQDKELRRQVTLEGDAWEHPAVIENLPDGTRFVLSTPESGGVTELDVALASRISDLTHHLVRAEPGVEAEREDEPDVVSGAAENELPSPGTALPQARF